MAARTKARKRAVDLLYECELRGTDPLATAVERQAQADPPVAAYAVVLVEGVTAHRDEIDPLLTRHAQGWSLDRMPPVDRTILRLAAYELCFRDDVPSAVAIDEAVELARLLSTDDSPGFINGVLGGLLREREQQERPPH